MYDSACFLNHYASMSEEFFPKSKVHHQFFAPPSRQHCVTAAPPPGVVTVTQKSSATTAIVWSGPGAVERNIEQTINVTTASHVWYKLEWL
jgi:hypothetical protein